MYVKVVNDVVVKYPYSLSDLKKDNSKISFPRFLNNTILKNYGVYEVAATEPHEHDVHNHTKNIIESTPQKINGVWTQVWNVTNATEDEITTRTEERTKSVRDERDIKLSQTDWTQVADAPVDKTEWATYRQALRDIPEQEGFPWNIDWPEEPQ